MYLLLVNCAKLIERSLIWSALGRISKQGLLPMPIDDISAIRTSKQQIKVINNIRVDKIQTILQTSVSNGLFPQKL